MHQIEENAGGEGDGIEAGVIVDRTGEPAAKCHAQAAEQQQGWNAPRRFGCWKQLAHGQHVGRNDAAEAKAEHGRDGEESGLALDRKETDHGNHLTNGTGEDRAQPAHTVGHKAQNCRLRKARPSSIESIAAPTDAEIPTSVQRATRWPCGIAIGTQQQKPAAASIDKAVAGRNPSTGAAGRGPVASRSTPRASGAGPSISAAAGRISATSIAAKPSIVLRQPICASVAAKIGAQIAAETDEPLPSRARAVPQRRSNQRDTYVYSGAFIRSR